MERRIVFVFFGGGWSGGQMSGHRIWFKDVETWIRKSLATTAGVEANFLFITRRGSDVSQEAYTTAALQQLEKISDGEAVAVCYSAGAEIARRVAEKRPGLFKATLLVSGMEAGGFRWGTFLRCLWHGWVPFLKGFITGDVEITCTKCVQIFFTNTLESEGLLTAIQGALCPEPIKAVLACTPLRWLVGMPATKPFKCPTMAIIGREDFFLANAKYQDEAMHVVHVPKATHALPLQTVTLNKALKGLTQAFARLLSE